MLGTGKGRAQAQLPRAAAAAAASWMRKPHKTRPSLWSPRMRRACSGFWHLDTCWARSAQESLSCLPFASLGLGCGALLGTFISILKKTLGT